MASFRLLFEAERPESYWDVLGAHLLWAVTSAGVLLVAWFVPIGRIALPSCLSLRLTAVPCPFCGLTRSICAVAQGDLAAAVYNYPLSIIFYGAMACACAWHTTALLTRRRLRRGTWLQWPKGMLLVAIAALAANWAYRLLLGLQ